MSETGRRRKRQVAHHLSNAKRSLSPRSSPASDADSDSEVDELSMPESSGTQMPSTEPLHSSSESASRVDSREPSQAHTRKQTSPLLQQSRQYSQKQAYSSEEDE